MALRLIGRIAALASVSTLAEAGVPDYESVGWFGVVAPAGTPDGFGATIRSEIAKWSKVIAVSGVQIE